MNSFDTHLVSNLRPLVNMPSVAGTVTVEGQGEDRTTGDSSPPVQDSLAADKPADNTTADVKDTTEETATENAGKETSCEAPDGACPPQASSDENPALDKGEDGV